MLLVIAKLMKFCNYKPDEVFALYYIYSLYILPQSIT